MLLYQDALRDVVKNTPVPLDKFKKIKIKKKKKKNKNLLFCRQWMQKEWEERCAKQEVLQAIRGGQQCSVTTDTAGRNGGTVPTPFTCQVLLPPRRGVLPWKSGLGWVTATLLLLLIP